MRRALQNVLVKMTKNFNDENCSSGRSEAETKRLKMAGLRSLFSRPAFMPFPEGQRAVFNSEAIAITKNERETTNPFNASHSSRRPERSRDIARRRRVITEWLAYPSPVARRAIKKSRRRRCSNLHIDDGWMGGGTSIMHVAPLSVFGIQAGDNNDFYDFKWGNGWDVNNNGNVDIGIDNLHGNFNVARRGIFHYCILGHNYADFPDSSGRGRFDDDDFFVSDGKLKDWWWYDHTKIQASTFMHELGHNLGLHHYGNVDQCPHIPDHQDGAGCPDYVSIMSYHYQLEYGRWPSSWGGLPNYGSRTGWNDWDNLNLAGVSNPGT